MNLEKLTDITAVICVRNSEKLIQRAILALLEQGLAPSNVIVVDGESVDQTAVLAKSLGCNVYSDEGKGFVAARSLGIEKTQTQFCLILGPDDSLEPGSILQLMLELSSAPSIAAVAARKRVAPELNQFLDKGMDFYYSQLQIGNVPVVGNPTLYKTRLLKECRYDPRFSANEDTDWCLTIRREGYEILRSERALSLEFEPLGWKEFVRRWLWYGEGDFVFVSKYFRLGPTKAMRHIFHPAREYLGRLVVRGVLARDARGIIFVIMCGLLRYVGFVRRMIGWLAGNRLVSVGR